MKSRSKWITAGALLTAALASGSSISARQTTALAQLTPEQAKEAQKRDQEKWKALANEAGIPNATLTSAADPVETRMYLLAGGEILTVDRDGKNKQKLPTAAGTVVHFAVSPSQTHLLYVTGEPLERKRPNGDVYSNGTFKLYVSDVDGASPILLSEQVGDPNIDRFGGTGNPMFSYCGGPAYPHWAPDGRRILYTGWRDADDSVPFYVVDAQSVDRKETLVLRTPGPSRITIENPAAQAMSRHPFALQAIDDSNAVGRRGQGPSLTVFYCSDARWHPDGKSLTWTADATTDVAALWVRDLNGFDTSSAASARTGADRLPKGEQFLWAPNGEQVLVSRAFQEQGRAGFQVFIADRKSGQITRELFREQPGGITGPKIRPLAWSPDGTKVAVYVSQPNQANQLPTGTIKIFDVTAPPQTPPLEVVSGRIPPLSALVTQSRRAAFSADSRTFYFIHVTLASTPGLPITRSAIQAVSLGQPGAPPAATPTQPPAPIELYQQAAAISAVAIVTPRTSSVDVPDLPMVVPAAVLDGDIKPALLSGRTIVRDQLARAKQLTTARRKADAGEPFDSIKLLQKWYDGNEPILTAERKAREGAEAFFKLQATAWDRMDDAERSTVEKGLLDRALALRRYRTVQRGLVRERAGMGTIASAPDLNAYYDAVARATWAAQELESLSRSWGFVNAARLVAYGGYDAYELSDTRKDAKRVAAIEKAQRRHFETLIDVGLSATLASESQYESVMDARKSRLYGFKEWWKDTKQDFNDPFVVRGAGGLSIQLLASGLNVFDVVAGLGADSIKGGLNYVFGADFKSRAEKLEQSSMENWDKTLRKLVLLRLLRTRSLTDLRPLAEQAAHDTALTGLPLVPGKVDAEHISLLLEDRAFHEITGGGLHRILGVALNDYIMRCRMELVIAKEQTRLIGRDMLSARRLEMGLDPETGEKTWGTALSPSTWADTKFKGMWSQQDFAQRDAQIEIKARQRDTMTRLAGDFARIDFDFERLPQGSIKDHLTLLANSAPYTNFAVKIREESTSRFLHVWRKNMRSFANDPEAAASVVRAQARLLTSVRNERAAEGLRMLELAYEDLIYSWDLGGALSIAEAQAQDPEWAKRVTVLKDAIATESVKRRGIDVARNVGDIGFMAFGFGMAGRVLGVGAGWGGAEARAAAAEAGLPVVEGAAAAAEELTFAQYVMGAFNPLYHGSRAVLSQSLTEILVDMGVPATGQKYEALLNQILNVLVDMTLDSMSQRFNRARARLAAIAERERASYKDLGASGYASDVHHRSLLAASDLLVSLAERAAKASDPEVRASLERQGADAAREGRRWLITQWLDGQARLFKDALRNRIEEAGLHQRYIRLLADIRRTIMPPTLEFYDRVLADRPGDLFEAGKLLDIQSLRDDFKDLRKRTPREDKPRLEAIERRIDEARHARFLEAMSEFGQQAGQSVEGVILNGTTFGNPEYKGIFSDKDLTIIIREGVNADAVRNAVNAAFAKRGILLNENRKLPSADIEAMIQSFLPGDVPAITNWKSFDLWALRLTKDSTRYLSAGGAEWVGLYNYLNGGTLSFVDGKAVVDAVPNRKLLVQPPLHPMLAHGLVLDNARFDKLQRAADIPDAATLADLLGARAKYVLRVVDALIWAKAPERLKNRQPADAQAKGYHTLLLEDAVSLASESFPSAKGRRPVISPEELRTIQIASELKNGKTIFQVLDIEPRNAQASRARLEEIWNQMDLVVKRGYVETREAYLDWLRRFANDAQGDPRHTELLYTVAFRNWNAARYINDPKHPQKLAILTGDTRGDPLTAMRRIEQDIIGASPPPGMEAPVARPPPATTDAATASVAVAPIHELGDRGDLRPAAGIDPDAPPTRPLDVTPPPPARSPAFDEAFPPDSLSEIANGDGKYKGERVAMVKDNFSEDPLEPVHEVVAYRLGRVLDVNVPYTGRVEVVEPGGSKETKAVMRWVPGHTLGEVLRGESYTHEPVTRPTGPAMLRVQAQYIRDVLMSIILGDFDRHGGNGIISDGNYIGIDHGRSVPIDADGSPDAVRTEMTRRLRGEGYPKKGETSPRYRKFDGDLGITLDSLLKQWRDMKGKVVDAAGRVNEQLLGEIAAEYGADRNAVVRTWKLRIEAMEAALTDVFSTKWETKGMREGYAEKDVDWKVFYYNEQQRETMARATVGPDGKLYNPAGDAADTSSMNVNATVGYAIYVIDAEGRMYITIGKVGSFHHSSLLEGRAVAAAGEVKIVNGKVVYIDLNSGHYAHPIEFVDQLRKILQATGVDISGTEIRHLPTSDRGR